MATLIFDNVYLDKVFTSSREKENLYSQLKINKYFKKFYKFDDSVLNMINKKKKEVYSFFLFFYRIYKYNTKTKTWTHYTSLPVATRFPSAAYNANDNSIYVIWLLIIFR